jgi:nicotinate-nucleotide pyrophosphorylase (carboxylating)
MSTLSLLQLEAIVKAALLEDLGQGDVLSQAVEAWFTQAQQPVPTVTAHITPRQACIVSGIAVAQAVAYYVDPLLHCTALVSDGASITAGTPILRLQGSLTSIQQAERTLLNFMQHLSGIATQTQRFARAIEGTGCRIAHTRKTTPNLRLLEQQAVLHGGGYCHRYNLGSTAMFKDTLLQSLDTDMVALAKHVKRYLPHTAKLEIEADTLDLVHLALEAGAEVILLDNMTLDELQAAKAIIAGKALIEISGGITLDNIRAYAQLGADVISTSQLTLGAMPIDIGLDIQRHEASMLG